MSRAQRRVDRAVQWTPSQDWTRYEPEWRADLAAAERQGVDPGDVSRGALKLARRLRARQLERLLLGGRGLGRAAVGWVGVAGLALAAFLVGNVVLLALVLTVVLLVVVFARAGAPSHWSHWLMVTSLVVGAAAAGFVWWVSGVRIDAADSGTPEPAIAAWGGLALIMAALSSIGLLVAAGAAVTRERRLSRLSQPTDASKG